MESPSTLVDEIRSLLQAAQIVDAPAEAEQIIAVAEQAGSRVAEQARALATARARGRPLGLVLGRERFMGLTLETANGVIAPRAETELLARTAIQLGQRLTSPDPIVVDMCTGSGNLACAIAHHLPSVRVFAGDLTAACVALATRNVARLGLQQRVQVAQGDLFEALRPFELAGRVSLVVCNPPYISHGRLEKDRANLLEHEPREAFDGGPYGLSIHQRVARDALAFLEPGGQLLFEIGLGQERQAKLLIDRTKGYGEVIFVNDADGAPRVVSAARS